MKKLLLILLLACSVFSQKAPTYADGVVLYARRGDKDGLMNWKDGMVPDYSDTTAWKIRPKLSKWMTQVYVPIGINSSLLEDAKALLNSTSFARRKWKVNYEKMASYIAPLVYKGISYDSAQIMDRIRSKKAIPIIDLRHLGKAELMTFFERTVAQEGVLILMTVRRGLLSVGSAADYLNHVLALADIDAAGLDSALTFFNITNVINSASAIMTEGLGTFKLKIDGNGFATSLAHAGTGFDLRPSSAGTIEFCGNNLTTTVTATGAQQVAFQVVTGSVIADIHDNIFNCNDSTQGLVFLDADVIGNIYNNLLKDASGSAVYVISGIAASSEIFNNTIDGGPIGFRLSSFAMTLRNNVVINTSSFCYFANDGANGYFNSGSDATGADGTWLADSNNTASITATDEYIDFDGYVVDTVNGTIWNTGTGGLRSAGYDGNVDPSAINGYSSRGFTQVLEVLAPDDDTKNGIYNKGIYYKKLYNKGIYHKGTYFQGDGL